MSRAGVALAIALASCAPASLPAHAIPTKSTPPAPPVAAQPPAPKAAPPSPTAPETTKTADLLAFERVIEAPVHSLALGKGGRVAALGDRAWLDDGKGMKQLPSPPKSSADVQIYFGRDDQPRLMGFARSAVGDEAVYLRWRGGAWQRGASEIGRLGGGPPAALFGVLGYDDPEVVCRVGDQCIVKRLTGWKTISAPAGLPQVILCGPNVWAFEKNRIFRLDEGSFRSFGEAPPFKEVDGLWAVSEKELWIAEREASAIHHFDQGRWTSIESPVREPRRLWATAGSDVWLVGAGGAAHYDGQSWTRASGAPESLAIVTGRSADEVWLAGATGVWRGKRRG